ncbi:hypothetical protein J6590_105264, partial [Homalodisca vitripennis]
MADIDIKNRLNTWTISRVQRLAPTHGRRRAVSPESGVPEDLRSNVDTFFLQALSRLDTLA